MRSNGKKLLRFALLALVLVAACELLFFNLKPLTSLGGSWEPLPEPIITGKLKKDKSVTLQFIGLDQELRWCHLEIHVHNKEGKPVATDLTVMYSDEGNEDLYSAGTVSYSPSHAQGSYFRVNSYGKIRDLQVRLDVNDAGCTFEIVAAEINGSVPFHISLPRVAGLYALLLLFWFLRPSSVLHDNRVWNRRPWAKALCVLLILLLNGSVLLPLAKSNYVMTHIPDQAKWAHHHQYAMLARALSEGKTWIDKPEQARELKWLAEMDNPYDYNARTRAFYPNGAYPPWDIAYRNDHLYVYFGIVPVLLTYLPYYLLTGNDLPTLYAVWAACVLVLIGAFVCMRGLIRRYFPRTPFTSYLLLSLLLGDCTGVLFYAVDPNFYVVPIFFALGFVLLALGFWLSAAERWEKALGLHDAPADPETLCFAPLRSTPRPVGIGLRIAQGALLAALVAGCRPQFLVFSALALPIFGSFFRAEGRRAVTLRRVLLFVLPYVAVAIPLMYYNKIRFGSPFDFGANYNLTTNDMTHRGFRLTRLPDGLFAYLFALPNVKLQFPYFFSSYVTPIYMGRTILERMFGGVLVLFPFLWQIFRVRRVRETLKEKKLRLFFLLPLVLAVIVVAADTEMAGILWRYTTDYLALLYLPAFLVFLSLLEKAEPGRRRRLLIFLTATTFFTLAACFLISLPNSSLTNRAPEAYYRLKDLLSWG